LDEKPQVLAREPENSISFESPMDGKQQLTVHVR
jgi:hypothetical protein